MKIDKLYGFISPTGDLARLSIERLPNGGTSLSLQVREEIREEDSTMRQAMKFFYSPIFLFPLCECGQISEDPDIKKKLNKYKYKIFSTTSFEYLDKLPTRCEERVEIKK
jgi:hypothetical protein